MKTPHFLLRYFSSMAHKRPWKSFISFCTDSISDIICLKSALDSLRAHKKRAMLAPTIVKTCDQSMKIPQSLLLFLSSMVHKRPWKSLDSAYVSEFMLAINSLMDTISVCIRESIKNNKIVIPTNKVINCAQSILKPYC